MARKIAILVVGSVVLLAGIIMIFTPGQGILTILLGLGILATEFLWARMLLERAKKHAGEAADRIRGKQPAEPVETSPSDSEPDSETR